MVLLERSFKVHVLVVKYPSILAPSKVSYFIAGKALYVAVIKGYASWWRRGRVVEGAPLLRECTLTRTEGSNPFVSATTPNLLFYYQYLRGFLPLNDLILSPQFDLSDFGLYLAKMAGLTI